MRLAAVVYGHLVSGGGFTVERKLESTSASTSFATPLPQGFKKPLLADSPQATGADDDLKLKVCHIFPGSLYRILHSGGKRRPAHQLYFLEICRPNTANLEIKAKGYPLRYFDDPLPYCLFIGSLHVVLVHFTLFSRWEMFSMLFWAVLSFYFFGLCHRKINDIDLGVTTCSSLMVRTLVARRSFRSRRLQSMCWNGSCCPGTRAYAQHRILLFVVPISQFAVLITIKLCARSSLMRSAINVPSIDMNFGSLAPWNAGANEPLTQVWMLIGNAN